MAAMSTTWHGAEEFRPLLRPIAELTPDPDNARTHSERNVATVKASLATFGQHRVAVCAGIQGQNVVMIGNAMLQAARELGWTHLAAIVTDDEPETARLRALVDNRSGDAEIGSAWDFSRLADAITEADNGAWDLSALGWTEDERRQLATWTPGGESEPEEGAGNPETDGKVCPNCGEPV